MKIVYKFAGNKQAYSYLLPSDRGSVDRSNFAEWVAKKHALDLRDCELELTIIPPIPANTPIPYYSRVLIRRLPRRPTK